MRFKGLSEAQTRSGMCQKKQEKNPKLTKLIFELPSYF